MVETESYIGKLIEVLLTIGILAVSLYAIFWLIYQPEWTEYSVTVRDPFSGFVYYLDYDEDYASVSDIVHTLGVKDGCLKIPESFWGKTVKKIGIQNGRVNSKGRIQTIEISDSVTTIGVLKVSNVEEVTGGENVTFIMEGAFENCEFKKVMLGDEIRSIGAGAFSGCTNLVEVNLGKYLENIEDRTFYGCTSLKQIQLGYNVTWVGEEAFAGCSSLETVTQTANLRSIHPKAFDGTPWSESGEGKAMILAY